MVLLVREAWWQARLFFRNPMLVLTTVALPLVLVPLLHELNPDAVVPVAADPGSWGVSVASPEPSGGSRGIFTMGGSLPGPFLPYDQYLVPALGVFGVAAACFAGLALRVTVAREEGVLKRMRGLPIPLWVHLGGRVAAAILVGWTVMVAVVGLGALLYDVDVPVDRAAGLLGIVALMSVCFCALGLAVTVVLSSREAAPAVVLAILIPVGFLSHVFYPPHLAPPWMRTAARWLPLEPAADLATGAFNPFQPDGWLDGGSVARLVAWTVAGSVAVVLFFRWTPSVERTSRRPSRVLAAAAAGSVAIAGVGLAAVRAGDGGAAGSPTGAVSVGELDDLPAGGVTEIAVPGSPWGALLAARSEAGDVTFFIADHGCAVRGLSEVDPAWLTGARLDASGGALVGLCGPSLHDGDGVCIQGDCRGNLTRLAAGRDDRGWWVDPMQVITPDGVISEPSVASARRTIVYRAEAPDTAAVWGQRGLEIVAERTVRLETPDASGGAVTGIEVDGVLFPVPPVQLLSLPVGAVDGEDGFGLRVERPGEQTWRLHLDLGEGPGTIDIVGTERDVPAGPMHVEIDLRLPGLDPVGMRVVLTPITDVTALS